MDTTLMMTWSVQKVKALKDWRLGSGADQPIEEGSSKLFELSEGFLGVNSQTVTRDGGVVTCHRK